MWLSQNFLLYNGTIIAVKVNEWINNFFLNNFLWQPSSYFGGCIHYVQIKAIINFKNKQTILIPVKFNHKCTKEINLMPSGQFSFPNFLLKMKKIDKYGLSYHRWMVQPLVLRILRCSFCKY